MSFLFCFYNELMLIFIFMNENRLSILNEITLQCKNMLCWHLSMYHHNSRLKELIKHLEGVLKWRGKNMLMDILQLMFPSRIQVSYTFFVFLISPCLWFVPCSKVTESPKSAILIVLVPKREYCHICCKCNWGLKEYSWCVS